MIKYATAIRTRTAQTEAILRRFMQTNAIHPTYQAMIELAARRRRSSSAAICATATFSARSRRD